MLPTNVERFLASSIRSVWDLELLLLLRREKARNWTSDAMIRELRASSVIVNEAIGTLEKAGFVMDVGRNEFRYHPVTPELDGLAAALAEAYASFPAAVMDAIWSAPSAKIRTFADAFKIKKD